MTMTPHEAFLRGTETFNAHDIEGFAKVLADDVVFSAPGGIGGAGREACAGFFAGWFSAFPDARVDVSDVHIDGDVVVEVGTFTGTHRGALQTPGGDIPPTGRPVAVAYTQVLHFRDGEHISFNLMFDRLQMLEQLGLAPQPEPVG
jgi:predicted ester cyclase